MRFFFKISNLFLALALLPAWACAVSITITGEGSADGTWDVTTVTGTFNTLQSQLEAQEWWGDRDLAIVFANELGASLGTPNAAFGPYFAYTPWGYDNHGTWFIGYRDGTALDWNILSTTSGTWAVSARAAVPDTGSTAALLGAGVVALAFARRRLG